MTRVKFARYRSAMRIHSMEEPGSACWYVYFGRWNFCRGVVASAQAVHEPMGRW